jgi:hypothetical protein
MSDILYLRELPFCTTVNRVLCLVYAYQVLGGSLVQPCAYFGPLLHLGAELDGPMLADPEHPKFNVLDGYPGLWDS